MSPETEHQRLGRISRAQGKRFEDRLDASFAYYRQKGFAVIEKTPEPMKVLRRMEQGRFVACFQKKAQPDYKGIIKGGREVMYEAKFTAADRMEQNRVMDSQAEYMREHEKLGARCYVLAGFSTGAVYCIPWNVWDDMKTHFGRKYITEADVTNYRVQQSWNDVLLILN